jgi:hypothetical protein
MQKIALITHWNDPTTEFMDSQSLYRALLDHDQFTPYVICPAAGTQIFEEKNNPNLFRSGLEDTEEERTRLVEWIKEHRISKFLVRQTCGEQFSFLQTIPNTTFVYLRTDHGIPDPNRKYGLYIQSPSMKHPSGVRILPFPSPIPKFAPLPEVSRQDLFLPPMEQGDDCWGDLLFVPITSSPTNLDHLETLLGVVAYATQYKLLNKPLQVFAHFQFESQVPDAIYGLLDQFSNLHVSVGYKDMETLCVLMKQFDLMMPLAFDPKEHADTRFWCRLATGLELPYILPKELEYDYLLSIMPLTDLNSSGIKQAIINFYKQDNAARQNRIRYILSLAKGADYPILISQLNDLL